MEIKLPELGEGIEAGDVLAVLVTPGQTIKKDDPLIEIETDKATLEVPSESDGVVDQILIEQGTQIKVGDPILTLKAEDGLKATEPSAPETPAHSQKVNSKKENESKGNDGNKASPATSPITPQVTSSVSSGKSIEVKLPELGEGIEAGDVIGVLVKAGDNIEKDQPLIEIETDKATLEVPAPESGTVEKVLVETSQKLAIGDVILKLVMGSSSGNVTATPVPDPAATKTVPNLTQAQTIEPNKPAHSPSTSLEPSGPPPEKKPAAKKKLVPAAPSVRRFAFEIGIEITEVPGSGVNGRISVDDVKKYSKQLNANRSSSPAPAQQTPSLPDFSKFGTIESVTMSKIRQVTSDHMTRCWNTVPSVTQFGKADITEIEDLRKRYKSQVEAKGGKLTITAILVKVLASAVKEFPEFNASVDAANHNIIYKKYVNIGIAVDTPNGLLVPVIKNADELNLTEISIALTKMANKAKDRKVTPSDLQGGCMTITNLGGIGGTYFSPIVNWPEVAILGISKSSLEPIYQDGKLTPQLKMPLSLTYDHRIIDGAAGVRFLNYICNALEDPFILALDG